MIQIAIKHYMENLMIALNINNKLNSIYFSGRTIYDSFEDFLSKLRTLEVAVGVMVSISSLL